jgi:transcriptional regulator with XRE-family HTH domain
MLYYYQKGVAPMSEKNLKTIIAQFIRTIRERENMTQSELGKGADMGQDSIARVEADEGPLPRLDAIGRILAGAGYELQLRAVKKSTTIEITI